jgi:hypothetical protein
MLLYNAVPIIFCLALRAEAGKDIGTETAAVSNLLRNAEREKANAAISKQPAILGHPISDHAAYNVVSLVSLLHSISHYDTNQIL